jgi:uncharacterized membrane protein
VWVNDWGQAVGSAQNDVADQFSFMGLGTQTRGFISTGETIHDLGTHGGPDTFAQYVNNRGQVAGVSYTSNAADPAIGVPHLDPFLCAAVPSAQAYIKTRMRRYQIPGR